MTSDRRARPLSNWLDFWAVCFSTCFFLSYIPAQFLKYLPFGTARHYLEVHKRTGAGFVGSICGVLTFLLLPPHLAGSLLFIMIGLFFAVVVSQRAERISGIKDDARIVVDEWIGMWIATWGLGQMIGFPLLLAFILFRLFDVVKGPWGRWIQRMPGGWGIIMDDVVAGILANICLRIILLITHL